MRGWFAPALLIVLCSCGGTAKTPAQYGDSLLQSGKLLEAEREYERVMGKELASDEFSYARNQLCVTRMRRATAAFASNIE